MDTNRKYLTTREAAEYIGMSVAYLEHDRRADRPQFPFIRIGTERGVKYSRETLDRVMKALTTGTVPA